MPSFAARTVGVLALLTGLLAAREAAAFCRTGTCSLPANFNPTAAMCDPPGFENCVFNGAEIRNVPLWWRTSCVGYSVQRAASKHVSLDDVSKAAASAFGAWSVRSCPTDGTGTSRVTIDARDLGAVECDEVGYYDDRPNQHVIVFRDDSWPHRSAADIASHTPSGTIALTTVSFDPSTGEIFDADIEINSADHVVILTDTPGSNVYDLESVLTHEAGHFLGMAHSADKQAVMYYEDEGGSSRHRDLSADDIAAVCTVYPPSGLRPVDPQAASGGTIPAGACDPTPRQGLSVDCAPAPSATSTGCAIAHFGAALPDGAPGILVLLGLGLARRRRPREGIAGGRRCERDRRMRSRVARAAVVFSVARVALGLVACTDGSAPSPGGVGSAQPSPAEGGSPDGTTPLFDGGSVDSGAADGEADAPMMEGGGADAGDAVAE